MDRAKTYKAVGVALFFFGALIFGLGFSKGGSELRIAGPVLASIGITLFAQAKKPPRP